MKLLKTIRDIDLGFKTPAPDSYKERTAARAIVFDENNNLVLLHSTKNNYYLIPGGGVEDGEEIQEALNREILEEIGCRIADIQELGIIEEYRNEDALHQISHCFIAKLDGDKVEPKFTQSEIEQGFQPVWLTIDNAIKIFNDEKMKEFRKGKFMATRELFFLNEAKKIILQK